MKTLIMLLAIMLFPLALISQVVPEWTAIFNGPACWGDQASSIATDDQGNIFVAGVTVNASTNTSDYVLIKYDPAGGQTWSQSYNGPGNWDDNANALAVDKNGNACITGGSDQGNATSIDYVTIRYSAAGSQDWTSYYRGLNSDNEDVAADIAVDDNGFYYITGASAGTFSFMWADIATLKLTPGGDTVWTSRIGGSDNDRGTSITPDNEGYAYVAGYVHGGNAERYNYAVIKYTPAGDTAWLRVYNGTGSDEDVPYAIAVDDQRNVYVTGMSWGTFYDDYATLKYDSSGNLKWIARYNGPANSYDKAYDLKIGADGNIYVTGASGGSGFNYDYTTICYSPEGAERWVARYNGPDNKNDHAAALVLDASGNIYVTGYSENANAKRDIVTVKYNPSGQEQWVYRYDGPGVYHDQASAIAADKFGNIYVAGTTQNYGQDNTSDIVTMKFAAAEGISEQGHGTGMFSISPNPAADKAVVTFDGTFATGQLDVLNMLQQVVLSKPVQSGQALTIDTRQLTEGIYFVRINSDHRTLVQRLIIRR